MAGQVWNYVHAYLSINPVKKVEEELRLSAQDMEDWGSRPSLKPSFLSLPSIALFSVGFILCQPCACFKEDHLHLAGGCIGLVIG